MAIGTCYVISPYANFARKVTKHKRRLASGKVITVGGGRFRKDLGGGARRGAIAGSVLGAAGNALVGGALLGPAGAVGGAVGGALGGGLNGSLIGAGAGAARYGFRENAAARARKRGEGSRIRYER